MRAEWMPLAKEAVRDTAKYIRKEFGKQYRDNFMREVREANFLISDNPYAGKIEPLLEDDPDMYRSFVVARLNKMVYRILDDHIEVDDFWDCRRDPDALIDRLK